MGRAREGAEEILMPLKCEHREPNGQEEGLELAVAKREGGENRMRRSREREALRGWEAKANPNGQKNKPGFIFLPLASERSFRKDISGNAFNGHFFHSAFDETRKLYFRRIKRGGGTRARLRVFLPVPQLARRVPLPSCCREVWAAPASSFSSSHTQNSNSRFFISLRSRGFNLEFRLADDPNLTLQRYGQYLYDGLVLFSPSAQRLGGSLDVAAVLDFVDSGHDLILVADVGASDRIRDIAAECGADFDEILKVLTTSPSAYSANPNTKLSSPPTLTGSAISLVYVVQAIKT
ncbi:Dolichyl-diphosphooligosaccharide--protein glycosyltransferase subunit [Nymphaea thermarum]|nr:Dolichyl-diphosphooligosaccharide--protein glycosyltransferase subunit [Nymphaea thermarum]